VRLQQEIGAWRASIGSSEPQMLLSINYGAIAAHVHVAAPDCSVARGRGANGVNKYTEARSDGKGAALVRSVCLLG